MMAEQEKPKRKTRGPWTTEERAKREENKRLRAEGKLPPKKKQGHKPWTEEAKRAMGQKNREHFANKDKAAWEAAQESLTIIRKQQLESLQFEPLEPGEPKKNSRYLREARVAYNLPPIDTSDPAQVEQRINDYLDFCEANEKRPTVVGLANWIGVSSREITYWKNGQDRGGSVTKIIQRYRAMMEEYMVDQLQESKTNPANLIFLMKNMFGYKDQTDIVVGQNNSEDQNISKEDLEQWFLEDGKTVETTFKEDGQ